MPKKPLDYSKTIIYKIVCNDLTIKDSYVGHTTNFIKRRQNHKSQCNNESNKSYNYKIYQIIKLNGGWLNFSMIEIEKYPCLDINEACARERYWIETLGSQMNFQVPNRSDKEIAELKKEWNENNKGYHKDYYKAKKALLAISI